MTYNKSVGQSRWKNLPYFAVQLGFVNQLVCMYMSCTWTDGVERLWGVTGRSTLAVPKKSVLSVSLKSHFNKHILTTNMFRFIYSLSSYEVCMTN